MKDIQLFIRDVFGDTDVNIDRLTGDASTREYYRVKNDDKAFIVCKDTSSNKKIFLDFLQIQRVLEENCVRVPKILHSDHSTGYILQEDLGEMTFLKRIAKIDSVQEEYELYKKLIDVLIKIQIIDPSLYTTHPWVNRAFDQHKFLTEVDFTCNFFFKKFLTRNGTSLDRAKKCFDELCYIIAEQKKSMAHRDFHSKNIMIKEEEFIVIDFQDAMMGIPQYDLVSLLEDCYYKVSCSSKESLKKYYWDNSSQIRENQKTFDNFHYYYDLTLVQRSFKAIGTFAYLFDEKKTPHYLQYIGRAYENIRETLFKYDSFKDLRNALNGLYYGD